MNYLTVELLTIIYPIFLLYKNHFPLVMIIVIIVHGIRFEKNHDKVNKEIQPNFQIFVLYVLLIFGLFYFKNFVLFGILFGLVQYGTYYFHEKQSLQKYKWIEYPIDIPITLISTYISYIGYKTNNLFLAPFLGDLVYHLIEFYNFK